ncbi:MAG: hypothetical protein APF76_10005 [Desulfitibacter sp. BRH_c19]|nr:MAG: hypothetical protein APF76_10005 [Desulfitibacter sp. BRH_c19]
MSQELREYLIEHIANKPLRFYDFMKIALYHPIWGYYVKDKPKIGREGDFYTSPNVHSAFGHCIAEQLYEMWTICKKPKEFYLVEMGPGTGLLAKDILDYSQDYGDYYDAIAYVLIETSPYMTDVQKRQLEGHAGKCRWENSISKINNFTGIVFSNELVDAFPIHKVTQLDGKLKEIYIQYENGAFCEEIGELSNNDIADYLDELHISLEDEQEIEVNLDAINWLEEVASKLEKGFLITIDYGYKTKELEEPFRFKGTLMSYSNHTNTQDVLLNPGEQDITSHVNFSAIKHYGEKTGLQTAGYTSQMRFLVNLNIADKMKLGSDLEGVKNSYALKRLTMPDGMGEKFKVLIQHKDIEVKGLKGLNGFFSTLKI